MIVTTDEALIRSYLDDDTVREGFGPVDDVLMPDALYFYEPDVGLFPARYEGNVINVHAAIPKKNRGIKMIRAAKHLGQWLLARDWRVFTTVEHEKRHIIHCIKLIGFMKIGELDRYAVYRYR